MGSRHADEFLRMQAAGQFRGERATAWAAARAARLDAAEDRAERQDVSVTYPRGLGSQPVAASSRRSGRPADDDLYAAIFPTPDEVIAAREAEVAEARALSDDELYERLFGGS